MRIGIVTEYYRPWPGGISEHVHHEALELTRRGHTVHVVTGPATVPGGGNAPRPDTAGTPLPFGIVRRGFEKQFDHNGAANRMVLGPHLMALGREFRRLRLDVVHVHAPMDPFLAWAALLASPVATVGTFHANFEPSPLWDWLFHRLRFLTGPIFRRMHARIAVAPEAERSIARYFPADYEIIPNGVDTERFHPDIPKARGLDDDRPTLLFVGRADPRKGLPHLLAAFPEIRRRVPGARLVVVGARREEVARELSCLDTAVQADIVFSGYVSAEALPGYHSACDLFCSPATGQESQGIVLLEAMAAGRPPVAFDIPGYRDVVQHGENGWLVETQASEPLARALAQLLTDDTLRGELARAGRRTALRYAWPAIAERIEAQLELARERARNTTS